MYSIHLARKQELQRLELQETTAKEERILFSEERRKRRDQLANGYKARVDEWVECADQHLPSGPTPHYSKEKSLYSLAGGRNTEPQKFLGSPRMSPRTWVPEKERVALADQVLSERVDSPYKDPVNYPLRLRLKEKEVQAPMRYTARTTTERVADVLDTRPSHLEDLRYADKSALLDTGAGCRSPKYHVFRQQSPGQWKAGQFNRRFDRVKARPHEPIAAPALAEQVKSNSLPPPQQYPTEPYKKHNEWPFRPNLDKAAPPQKPSSAELEASLTGRSPNTQRNTYRSTYSSGSKTARADLRPVNKTYWKATKELGFGPEEQGRARPLYLDRFPPSMTVN